MSWATGHATRPGRAPGPNRTRRLILAVSVALVSAVGTAAVDSAVKAHSGAASVEVVAADAAYSARPASPPATARPSAVPPSTAAAPPTTSVPPTTTPPTTATTATTAATTAVPVTRPAPPPTTAPNQARQAVATALQTRSTTPAAPALASADTCAAAIAYLSAHSAPGFQFECPGNALGHQAMTCINVAGVCPGAKLIVISVVCPASYMNEAHNSWVLSGLQTGSIDPYGYCH